MTFLLTPVGARLNDFWRWWIGELVAVVPARARHWVGALRQRRILIIGDRTSELVFEGGGQRVHLTNIGDKNDGLSPQAQAASAAPWKDVGTTIQLPAERALRSQITLPLAASRNLAQVVGFELERHTPFKRADVYFAHRLVRRDASSRTLVVEVTVVPRAIVDEALAIARRHSIEPLGVIVAAPPGGAAPSPNLLPQGRRDLVRSLPDIILAVALAAAIGLAGAALAIPLWQAHRTADELALRLAEAKREADASLQLQKEIDALTEDAQFLVVRRRQTPYVSALLADLTHLLPDDAWLTELTITASDVQISGFASSATALLASIDHAGSFTDAAFRASVTQDAKLGREQFDITAKLAGRGEK
jgi:general secretion pathway protein L